MRNMDESDGHILKTLVGRLLFSTTLALVALVPVACAYGIRLATPTPTPAPTPTPIPTIWADEALEELFWMSVDLVGENSQMPEINRTLSFMSQGRPSDYSFSQSCLGMLNIWRQEAYPLSRPHPIALT